MGGDTVLRGVYLPGGVPRSGEARGTWCGHWYLSGWGSRLSVVCQTGGEINQVHLLYGSDHVHLSVVVFRVTRGGAGIRGAAVAEAGDV